MTLFWLSEAVGFGLMFIGLAKMIVSVVRRREPQGFGFALAGWFVVVAVWVGALVSWAMVALAK